MAQTTINVRLDQKLKSEVEEVCREMGMNMTTAFVIYAKRLARDRKIPFEVNGEAPLLAYPGIDPYRVYETDYREDAPAHLPRFTTMDALCELLEECEANMTEDSGTPWKEVHAEIFGDLHE